MLELERESEHYREGYVLALGRPMVGYRKTLRSAIWRVCRLPCWDVRDLEVTRLGYGAMELRSDDGDRAVR